MQGPVAPADAFFLKPDTSSEAGSEQSEAESFDSPLSSVASFDLDRALQRLALDQQGTDSPFTCHTASDARTASTLYCSISPLERRHNYGGSSVEDDSEGSSAEGLTFMRSAAGQRSRNAQLVLAGTAAHVHACACTASHSSASP